MVLLKLSFPWCELSFSSVPLRFNLGSVSLLAARICSLDCSRVSHTEGHLSLSRSGRPHPYENPPLA